MEFACLLHMILSSMCPWTLIFLRFIRFLVPKNEKTNINDRMLRCESDREMSECGDLVDYRETIRDTWVFVIKMKPLVIYTLHKSVAMYFPLYSSHFSPLTIPNLDINTLNSCFFVIVYFIYSFLIEACITF